MALTLVPPPPPPPDIPDQTRAPEPPSVPEEPPVDPFLRGLGEYLASFSQGHPDFRPLRPAVPTLSASLVPFTRKLGLDPVRVRAVFVDSLRNPVSRKPKVENRFLMCLGCCAAADPEILSAMRAAYLEGENPFGVEPTLRVVLLGHALVQAGVEQTISLSPDLVAEIGRVADLAADSGCPRVRALGFGLQASLWDHHEPG